MFRKKRCEETLAHQEKVKKWTSGVTRVHVSERLAGVTSSIGIGRTGVTSDRKWRSTGGTSDTTKNGVRLGVPAASMRSGKEEHNGIVLELRHGDRLRCTGRLEWRPRIIKLEERTGGQPLRVLVAKKDCRSGSPA